MPYCQSYRRAASFGQVSSQAQPERPPIISQRSPHSFSHDYNQHIEEFSEPYYTSRGEPQSLLHAQHFGPAMNGKAMGPRRMDSAQIVAYEPPTIRATRSEGIRRTSTLQICKACLAAPALPKRNESRTVHFKDEKQQSPGTRFLTKLLSIRTRNSL
ncbi:hypothetical protein CPB83DRAFT_855301, partial [Crepidotus variabilis]